MSVQIYNYNMKFDWKIENAKFPIVTPDSDAQRAASEAAATADIIQGMNTVAAQQFAAKMAQTGHWYRVNSTNTAAQITARSGQPNVTTMWNDTFQGTTILNFDTDVADPNAHNSPQLLAVISAIILTIAAAIVAQPVLFFLIVLVIAIAIAGWVLINTFTGAIYQLGSNIGSLVLSLGVLVVVGLGIYAVFTTQAGRKAASRGYETAKRAYRRVRRR